MNLNSTLSEIFSGGQTGPDQAALAVAYDYGIKTGGSAPKGWLTEDGPAPWLGTKYGLIEHSSPGYPPRTITNIKDTDGTVLFGRSNSRGSLLAIKHAGLLGKPILFNKYGQAPKPEDLAWWIEEHEIRRLNVGGNRASSNPMAYTLTYTTLAKVFEILRQPVVDLTR